MQTRGGSLSSTLSSIMNRIKKEGNGAGATASKIKTVNRITMEDDEYNVMGIDLGTTNSCVAVWKNGQIAIVPNEMGLRTTPSVVSFFPNETLLVLEPQRRWNRISGIRFTTVND